MCRSRERAAYKKPVRGMSSKPRCSLGLRRRPSWHRKTPAKRCYFGRTLGLPPGLPGGGITGVLPASGVGACICGSTPAGGHNTPSDRASLSPSGSRASPVVVPCGGMVPFRGADGIGAHSPVCAGDGGAVGAGGVAGDGGAWAPTAPDAAISKQPRKSERLVPIQGKRPAGADVPHGTARAFSVPIESERGSGFLF